MEIIQRIPLTLTAFVSFGTFTLASLGFRAIRKYYYSRTRLHDDIESIGITVTADLRSEILKHVFSADLTDAELLQLSLVSKAWHAEINAFFATKQHPNVPALPPHYNQHLTPKLFYFFNKNRGNSPNEIDRVVLLPEDFELNTKYGPWLDHNILRHPENFWLFLKAALFNPEWILPVFIRTKHVNSSVRRILPSWVLCQMDQVNQKRFVKYVNFCSVLLSYLPFLDSIIYQFRTNMPESALVSSSSILLYIWNNSPWKITTQLRWLSQLAIFQLFDDVFFNFKAGFYRLALLIPFMVMNGGVQRLLIFAAIFAALFLFSRAAKKWKPAENIAVWTTLIAALWLYPVPSIFSSLTSLFMLVDGLLRTRTSVGTMKLNKFIFFGAIGCTVAALIFWRGY